MEREGVKYVLLTAPEMAVPPEALVYQRYCPVVPPDAVRVTDPGPHELPAEVAGAAGDGLITALTAVLVLSQPPMLMAIKYVVVMETDGVIYVLLTSPVIGDPPAVTVYQRYWPFVPPVAVRLVVPGPQELPAVATGADGSGAMFAFTIVRLLSQMPLLIET